MYFTQEDYKKIESWLLKNSVKDSDFQEAFSLKGKETVVVTQDGHNRKITVEDLSSELIKLGVSGFVNVSENFDVFGINLEEAIVLIPLTSRKRGIVITFYNTQGYWELYQFSGALNQWNNITLWKEIGKGTDTNNLATKEELNAKQDTISDLEAIRSGAALGATAIQSVKTINGQSVEGEGNITIEGGGSNITVDSELSDISENPVQNKVVTEAFGILEEHLAVHSKQISSLGLSMATKEELNNKVDKNGIKTINGESILGSGDIEIISSGEDSTLIRTLYTADESSGKTLTEEQMAYNAETYRMLADGTSPMVVFAGYVGSVAEMDLVDNFAHIFVKIDTGPYLAGGTVLLRKDGSVELGEKHFAIKLAELKNPEHAQLFFENYQVFPEMKGVFVISSNASGVTFAEVDFVGSENGFYYVEYNLHDKRFRVEFNADYTIKEEVEITPGGGTNITVDSSVSTTSTNPVQNKVVKAYVDTEVAKKVDKVSGKGLSTEDFTTLLKTKLEGLENYDDTTLTNAISSLETRLNTLVSGDTSTAIESFNEITAFLSGIEDSESLDSIIAAIEQQIAAKQDKLVSGMNIKTINGESILGEGNITIKGGGVSEEYVNNAIASAITNTLNTAV